MKPYRIPFSRSFTKLLYALLGLTLAFMLAFTFQFQHVPNQIQQSPAPSSPPPSQPPTTPLPETAPPTEQMQSSESTGKPQEEETILNLLLVGQDHQEGEPGARSDSIILCTFNPAANRLTLTSFLRDLYVPIPGHGSNRINAAYAFGGTALLRQTLEENFGLQIQGAVEVDFSQFAQIVDLLGGVELPLRQDEADLINLETASTLTEGTQLLNGLQALSYARIRRLDADGDFSRTSRQRRVLRAIWDSYQGAGTGTMLRLLREILPMITTDMSTTQILSCAMTLFPHLHEIQLSSQRIPQDGQYTNQTIDGMCVLVPDLEAARAIVQQLQDSEATNCEQSP